MNVIVLAGGFGTRLQEVVSDVPKPMAPINGIPFLEYVLNHMLKYHVEKVILAVGYKREAVFGYFKNGYGNLEIEYSNEDTPLGTGGAIKQAMDLLVGNDAIVLNGDTFMEIDYDALWEKHIRCANDITIGLKKMQHFDRYGAVKFDGERIVAFQEKEYRTEGYINTGVYAVNRDVFHDAKETRFSFESDILVKKVNDVLISGYISDGYFIDIGVPEDFEKAQKELKFYFDRKSGFPGQGRNDQPR